MKIVRIAKYEGYTQEFYNTPEGKRFLVSLQAWKDFIIKYYNWPEKIYLILASYKLNGEQISMEFKQESGYLFAIAYIYEEVIDTGEQIKQGNYEILDIQEYLCLASSLADIYYYKKGFVKICPHCGKKIE